MVRLELNDFSKKGDIVRLEYKDFKNGWGNYNPSPVNYEQEFEVPADIDGLEDLINSMNFLS